MNVPQEFIKEVMKQNEKGRIGKLALSGFKNKLAKKYKLQKTPTDIEIFISATNKQRSTLRSILLTKPARTGSGVAPVALMTKPINCKHGRCTYCPGGKRSFFGDVPQSYTGNEPSTMRGIRNNFDPYLIAMNRLEQYAVLGHDFSKVESIVMGGTFTSFDKRYQDYYLKYMFKAYNDFSEKFLKGTHVRFDDMKEFFELPGDIYDTNRTRSIQKKLLALKGKTTLAKEQKRNETASVRCVALCLETRPDWAKPQHVDRMIEQGTTRVEMGVQSIHDEVLTAVHRCHDVADTVRATRYLKDGLIKVGYHMMAGLPKMDYDKDLAQLRTIIEDPNFKPDALKIYPCMVMPGTPLYSQYKRGEYTPMETKEAAELISEFMRYVPPWLRIMRVQRDIPTKVTKAGVNRTNLRQYVEKRMKEKRIKGKDIRAREPKTEQHIKDWKQSRIEYESSMGTDVFLSFDNKKTNEILGFLRLRLPAKPWRKEFTNKTAGVRELHVYGSATALGKRGSVQHRGIGKKLLKTAESIAKEEWGMKDLLIISGVGAREYYKKAGYKRIGPYMKKKL